MNYIDLFAGAGGLSEGFIRNDYNPVAHIEKNKYPCLTLKTRTAYYYLKDNNIEEYRKYLKNKISREELYSCVPDNLLDKVINKEIDKSSIKDIFNRIDQIIKKNEISDINIIVGGPPCQAYSVVGRARDSKNMKNDPRNQLYKWYIKFLEKYKPELFVFENVPGILSVNDGKLFENIKKQMKNVGYKIKARLLDASKYGVLQKRKRVILVGLKEKYNMKYPDLEEVEIKNNTVGDLLKDLPSLNPGEEIRVGDYKSKPSTYLVKNKIRKKEDILTQHYARNHNYRDRQIYKNVIEVWNKEKRRLKYNELPDNLITHNNLKSFLDRFKVVAGDLPASQTVVAHISKDGHYYIHPDKKQLRSISTREAARLQSFPDNYFFEGPRTSIFRQIGNAVPPLLADKIAKAIKSYDFIKYIQSFKMRG